MIIELDYPIEYDGKSITQIELKRPKGKHLKHFPVSPGIGDLLDMGCRVSGLAQYVFDEMDAADVTKVCEVLADFLAGGQKTGS